MFGDSRAQLYSSLGLFREVFLRTIVLCYDSERQRMFIVVRSLGDCYLNKEACSLEGNLVQWYCSR